MNGILGNCELLGHTSLDSEQSELVACILDCGRLLLLCVNDLLDFQRLAAGKLRLEALPVCPSEVAASSAAVVAGECRLLATVVTHRRADFHVTAHMVAVRVQDQRLAKGYNWSSTSKRVGTSPCLRTPSDSSK